MVDQTKVTSGFDVEFLMTEEFIRFFLLCSLDTGSIPWATESSGASGTPPTPYRTVTIIHPPVALQNARLYPVFPEFEGHEHPHLDLAPAYSTRPDELQVTILDSDPRGADISVRVSPTVVDTLVVPPSVRVAGILPIDLALRFEIVSTARADGLLGDIELELELVDVSGPLIDAIEQLLSAPDPPPLPTRADILAQLKDTIDRSVPFAVSGGGALQRIETRTFAGDPDRPSAIGVYIDLALRNGPAPSEFLTTVRGDTSLAQNYLEPGMTMAFAFPAETYGLLSDDLKFKMARPKPDDPTEFHYPLMDGDDQIGVLHGITVRPETLPPGSPPVFTNALVIDVHGEYEVDNWFDPDFHLRLTLRPETGPRGVFDFDIDVDLSLSATATLSALFVGLVTSVFLPQLGIPLTFLTVIAIKAVEHYGAEAAGSAIESEGGMTSFLDTLPHKLVVEQRRWDPLYATDHRVETGDVELLVNADGFAMAANALFVGRRTWPLTSMVIRSETRAADGAMDGLVYRASDIGRYLSTDLQAVAAAVDRMPYVGLLPVAGDIESHRVQLTLEQVHDRIEAGDRHVADLDYVPAKVDVIAHQVFQILSVSQIETDEAPGIARGLLRAEYRSQHASTLRPQAIAELQAELGRAPTEDEIRARIEKIVADATEPGVPGRARVELSRRMRFDLEPSEFAALQRTGILTLGRDQLEIRTTPDGTVYYRDYERPFEPNTPTGDNLLSLPRYKHDDL